MSKEEKQEIQDIFESMKLDESIFTEEVMDKIKLVVESKVNTKLEDEKAKLEESNKIELSEFKDGLIDTLDEYMNYFVEEYTKENQKDIIDSVKLKSAQRVLESFNKMVNDFNISLSEDTIDQTEKITELEAELNESINESIDLKKELAESNKYALILDRVMKMKVDSEKSKFSKLAESFEYEDEQSFNEKLNTLQESLEVTYEDEETKLEEKELTNDKKVLIETINIPNTKKKYLEVLNKRSV